MTKDEREQAVREAAVRVYGAGARVEVERSGNGGQIRVMSADGKRLAGWHWDTTSMSQNTEEQGWYGLHEAIKDDERARVTGPSVAHYAAEIQCKTRSIGGRVLPAAALATELAAWEGEAGRSVAVYRVEGEDWTLVDRRTTRAQGTAPAGYQAGVQRDAAWDAALASLGVDAAWVDTIDRALHFGT